MGNIASRSLKQSNTDRKYTKEQVERLLTDCKRTGLEDKYHKRITLHYKRYTRIP